MTGLHKAKWDLLATKKRAFGALLVLCVLLLLPAGCGKHECAICGNPAKRTLTVAGKKLYICEDCYQDYIEIQQLYNEILD